MAMVRPLEKRTTGVEKDEIDNSPDKPGNFTKTEVREKKKHSISGKIPAELECFNLAELIFGIEKSSATAINFSFSKYDSLEFFMFFSEIGIIHGTGKIIRHSESDDYIRCVIKIDHLDDSDIHNLENMIKKQGFLVDRPLI